MKIERLNKDAVQSSATLKKRITTLAEDDLATVVAGVVECTCKYAYASSSVAFA